MWRRGPTSSTGWASARSGSAQFFQLSTGQQRRLALALAIAHRPSVVLLDEPTAGLDVGTRTELHLLMQELRDAGASIILATHDMAEAEKMADRVSILLKGRIVATGTPRELTATGQGLTRVAVRTEQSALAGNGTVFPAVTKRKLEEEYVVLYSTDPGPTVSAVLDAHQRARRQAGGPARGAALAGGALPGDHIAGRGRQVV